MKIQCQNEETVFPTKEAKKKKKKKKTAQERQVEMAIEKETTQWVQAFLILLGFTGRSFWKSKDSFGY